MTRPISTRMHGMLDYPYAAALIALPFLLHWDRRAAQLSISAGVATLGVSLLTNYELGAVRVLPMRAHLAMDAVESSMLMNARKMVGNVDEHAARVLSIF